MKFKDLVFRDLLADEIARMREDLPDGVNGYWDEHPLQRASVTLANGVNVSIVRGRWAFALWTPGLYEFMELDARGAPVPQTQVRGDAAMMQVTMDRVEQSRPPAWR